jgi:hypothetical protein
MTARPNRIGAAMWLQADAAALATVDAPALLVTAADSR